MTNPHLVQLGGLIERVTFHSEESGFAVLRVKARGHREQVTVVGTLPDVSAGEWVEAEGVWVVDRRHGRQFKAEMLRTTRPDTAEGIEKYLASGMVRGIGPAFAARLVEAFGTDVFDVIEEDPDRLYEVEGIGPKRREGILSAWSEQKAVREIMVFLHSHGVSAARAFRIYKTYGDDAISAVTEDPYRLARDIWGVGFKTADTIARSIGVDPQSDLRARAGVEHVLSTFTDEGHCASPRFELVRAAAEMLEIPTPIIERAVDHLLAEERIVERSLREETPLVYLAALDAAEDRLAENLRHLCEGPHPCPPVDVEKALAWARERTGLVLADAQKEAVRLAVRSKVLVITGGPGVGKTTIVDTALRILRAKKLRAVLCAPTGRAAKRMSETTGLEAKTIHRLLEFDPSSGGFKRDAGNRLEGDVFVVDESSMLDLVLAHQLVRAVPDHAMLILVGDVDQLPSVGPGMVLRDVMESGVVPVCRLTEIFRQARESRIVTNAHRVNGGEMPVYPRSKVSDPKESDFYFIETEEPDDGERMIVRLLTELLPEKFGLDVLEEVQVLTPMQRGILGARNLNTVLQEALNPDGPAMTRFGLVYRVGDKVMQIRNDYDKDVYNGDIGRIRALDEEEREAVIEYDGRRVTYLYDEFDEVTLSYAVTIHKSQGSEYPCVVMPVHTQHYVMLQRNLLYTGITRGRELVVVVGARKALGMAVRRADSRRRITTLRERLVGGSATATRLPLSWDDAPDASAWNLAAEPPEDYGE